MTDAANEGGAATSNPDKIDTMTDRPEQGAAPAEADAHRAEQDAAPADPGEFAQDEPPADQDAGDKRIKTGLARLMAPGGTDRRQAAERAERLARGETSPHVRDAAEVAAANKRRRTMAGVFAPVAPEARQLTQRQREFSKLVASGVSPVSAAKLAGYRAYTEAARLRDNPAVRAAIRRYRDQRIDKLASAAPDVLAEIMFDKAQKGETRLKAATWLLEAAGHGARVKEKSEKPSDTNDMREWSIEALEALLSERERNRRKDSATDVAAIVPDGTMGDSQAVEIVGETLPLGDSDRPPSGEAGGADG